MRFGRENNNTQKFRIFYGKNNSLAYSLNFQVIHPCVMASANFYLLANA
jgi:hypothetical protein